MIIYSQINGEEQKMKRFEKNDLFQAAHLTILISYSVFSIILSAETFLMGWETWPLIPIMVGVTLSWILHVQQSYSDQQRIWIYSAFIMFTYFFYGSHRTSVFDTVSVMSLLLILYTMVGYKPLITFLQVLYYVTFGYGLMMMWADGETFDSLIVSRSLLHFAVITAISTVSKTIIDKWLAVLKRSDGEIEKLTDATDRLNGFLANVSHETRTPINAIIGLTGICIDEEQDSEKRANLISVREAGRRVAEQISDILDFTEIDRKKLTNNYEDYMLSSLLNDLMEEVRPFKPKELELVIDVDPSIPSVMNTDVGKLRKILRHLIMNGIKYTAEGGVYVRLFSISEEYGVNLVIKVTDTGIGMTEEELERVFERYYQADSGKSRRGGGLGLGMTIVSGFTSALGGFLTISSKPDVGTTICVSLPQKVIEPSSCMSVDKPEKLCLGAFLHLDKYHDPNVREYYNMMIRNIVRGFGVQMHRVDNVSNLKKLLASVKLTHLFVAEEEYQAAADQIEKLASDIFVVVIADTDFRLPAGSHARIMVKPFYCFPVAAVLNAERSTQVTGEIVTFPNVRALAVDDEPMNLIVAKNIFRRYGIAVTAANSGKEAIELCRKQKFDIIFMDHMMPEMDGIEAMKLIRANLAKEHCEIPIVALTANAVSTARAMFLSVGFDGFVSKPIVLVELERVLKKLLSKFLVVTHSAQIQTSFAPVSEQTEVQPETECSAEIKPPDNESALRKLEAYGINTADALEYCDGDETFYFSLLQLFASEYNEKSKKMNRYLEEKDLKNYEILVHALKSTLRMLGGAVLSDRAKMLEYAAKDGNYELIVQNHDGLMADYRMLTEKIQMIFGKTTEDTPMETTDSRPVSVSVEEEAIEFQPVSASAEAEAMEFPPVSDHADEEVLEFAPSGEEQ